WNDPDAITLSGTLPEEQYRFHATMAVAAGGLVLSGDDLSTLPPDKIAMLKKLLPATGVAAEFEDHNLSTGIVRLNARTLLKSSTGRINRRPCPSNCRRRGVSPTCG